ncbi:MAG TPA: HhH-GPD-type base excision DNA repair protein [Solirubrobacteraceae bacterium]|nr:HhH-GPD-type base excision DNA repair protein [Solirubrobacteraceae bacterium]
MPEELPFTDSDQANRLLARDPMALLIGFVLDQQVTVQKAFSGPLVMRERLGAIDADTLAAADLDAVFRERPAIHRYPGSMAKRVHDMAVHVRDEYDGDAAAIWTSAPDTETLRANLAAVPGLGEMKIRSLGAVLARRFGVAAAQGLVPSHPTLGDVDSPQALADYQAVKRAHKAERAKARAAS